MENQISIYIHIPFCEKKCSYCNFPSSVGKSSVFQSYFSALEQEIISVSNLQNIKNVTSVFFGGGTPSSVSPKYISKILKLLQKNFLFSDYAEITVECNPNSITEKFADTMIGAGVNRFSIGIQSLNDDELKKLSRLHNSEKAESAYKLLRNAGAKNISLDFMYGIPGQTKKSFKNNLQRAVNEFNPEHISLYSLSIEPGTPFAGWKENKTKNWVWHDDDTMMNWFVTAEKYLSEKLYNKYEISNFAKKGFESIHNSSYWDTSKNYIGFGAAAHSFCSLTPDSPKRRFRNIKSVKKYIERVNAKQKFRVFSQQLNVKQQTGEKIYLGLRLAEGVELTPEETKLFENEIKQQIKLGLIKKMKKNKIVLTKRGFQIANTVMAEFV